MNTYMLVLFDSPAESPELVDMRRRFWISALLALPVAVLAMAEHLPGVHWRAPGWTLYLQAVLATVVVRRADGRWPRQRRRKRHGRL